jgi:hypothetical protein
MSTSFFSLIRTSGLTAALLAVSSIGAYAAEPTPGEWTREQVRAEYLRARAAGELASPAEIYAPVRQAMAESQRSVRALAAAREASLAASAAQRLGSVAR